MGPVVVVPGQPPGQIDGRVGVMRGTGSHRPFPQHGLDERSALPFVFGVYGRVRMCRMPSIRNTLRKSLRM